jgi:cysteine protease ATG4
MLFTFPQSVGIAGGRPSSSYYFVASQANSLFYLDPHITRPALPLEVPPSAPPAGASDDADEGVVVVLPLDRDSPVNVPYTLDVVDVDDLSDGSDASSSPTTRIRGQQRSTAAARLLSFPPGTPPSTRTRPSPDTPSTPFNSSDPLGHETPTGPGLSPAGPSRLAVDPQTLWYANAYSEAQLHTFHCEKVKKMPLSGLDPSMLLGFLCRDEADFADFRERVSKVIWAL